MFAEDGRTEQFLTQRGVKWRYVTGLKFEDLIATWEQTNLGRPKARVEEAILEYAGRMESGSPAPAAILMEPKPYQVLDGVQRLCAAHFLGETIFPAYIAECDDTMAAVLRVFANQLLNSGWAPSSAWNRAQAVQLLVVAKGLSIAEVARIGGWRLADVEADFQANTFGFAIRSIGGPDNLCKGVLLAIAEHATIDQIRSAPKPVSEFCHDLKKGKFSNGDALPHVAAFFDGVRKGKDVHKQFEKRLDAFRSDPDAVRHLEGRPTSRHSGETKLLSRLKAARTITEEMIAKKASLPYPEEFFQILNQIRDNIVSLQKKRQMA